MSERIIIEIDDTQLEQVVARLNAAMSTSQQAFGTRNVKQGAFELLDTLPSVNRELRVILGRIPGMRQAIQLYFRLRRIARGFDLAVAGDLLTITLAILATILIFTRQLQARQRRVERNYENLIRSYKDFSHNEYQRQYNIQENYYRRLPP